jgi:glycosyltransferase involved in cell wall biosynthesis
VIRVALLITSLNVGGAETQTVALAGHLRRRGHDVLVITLLPTAGLRDQLLDTGAQLTSLGMSRGVPDPRSLWRLYAILRSWQPDILHCHMTHPNLMGRIIGRMAGVGVIISTIHNTYEGGWWRKWAYRVTDRLAHRTTAVSSASAARYIALGAVPASRMCVVPNGIDVERFRPNVECRNARRRVLHVGDDFLWLAVGRLEAPKDYANMLDAFASVTTCTPGARLCIAGHGKLEAELRGRAQRLGIANRVDFLGLRRDIGELMSAADAFVMSSSTEGLPMVLLEAAATGLPIATTDVGGIGEIVRSGETGYLVPPHDSVALAAAMLTIQELDASQRSAMGARARARVVARYGLDAIASEWHCLYLQSLDADSSLTPAAVDLATQPHGPPRA